MTELERNVGGYDRIARLIIGAIVVIVGLAGALGMASLAMGPVSQLVASAVFLVIGVYVLATGVVQKCPVTNALGIDTYHRGRSTVEDETKAGRPS